MWKKSIGLAAALLAAASSMVCGSSITISAFILQARADFILNDLQSTPGIMRAMFTNSTGSPIDYTVEVKLVGPRGNTILSGRSKNTKTIAANSTAWMDNTTYRQEDMSGTVDKSIYTKVMQSGRLDAGTYLYSLKVYPANNPSDYDEKSDSITITNPSAPSLIDPVDAKLPAAVAGSKTFRWSAPTFRDGVSVSYIFSIYDMKADQTRESAVAVTPIYTKKGITDSYLAYPADAPAFTPGKKYAWRVRAVQDINNATVGATQNDGKSDIAEFTVQDYEPPILQNVLMSSFGQTRSIQAMFTSLPNAAYYQVEFSSTQGFSDKRSIKATDTTITVGPEQFPMDYNTTYYWRVQAFDDNNKSIAGYSSTGSFLTPAFGETPTLKSPVDIELLNMAPAFSWSAVTDSDQYILEWATDAGFQYKVSQTLDGTTTSWTPDSSAAQFVFNKKYYWRVKAKKNGKDWGQTPLSAWFIISNRFSPVLTMPVNSETLSQFPTFTWTPVNEADGYTLEISSDAGFSRKYTYEVDGASPRFTFNESTTPELSYNLTYYWRVIATRNDKAWGDPSGSAWFKPMFHQAPFLIGPVNTSISTLPYLQWTAVQKAENYSVELADNSNFSGKSTISVSGTSTNWPDTGAPALTDGKKYFWRVTAQKGNAAWGDRSETGYFIWSADTLENRQPQPLSPVGDSDSLTPLFRWVSVKEADHYELQLADNQGMQQAQKFSIDGSTAFCDLGTAHKLKYATTYYWRITAKKGGSVLGKVSDTQSFTTPELQNSPSLIYPVDMGVTTVPLQFRWSEIPESNGYQIQIARTYSFAQAWSRTVQTNTYTYDMQALEPKKDYYWRVIALDGNNKPFGQYSNTGFFTIMPQVTIDTEILRTSDTAPKNLTNPDLPAPAQPALSQSPVSQGQSSAGSTADTPETPALPPQDMSSVDWNQVKSNPDLLSQFDPSRIDFSKLDLEALKDIDTSAIKSQLQSKWAELKDKLKELSLSAPDLPRVDVGQALNKLFGGGGAGSGSKVTPELQDTGPAKLVAIRGISNEVLESKDKLNRVIEFALKEKGLDLKKYKIVQVKINNNAVLTDALQAKIKKGMVSIEITE